MTRVLGLTDGSAGMIAQVRALAQAMGWDVEWFTVRVPKIWHALPNRVFDLGFAHLFPLARRDSTRMPDYVISCGRKAALYAAFQHRYVLSHGHHTRFLHIQDPQMSSRWFDLVIAMEHDRLTGPNIISLPYALHSITPSALTDARERWQPRFAHLPRPWHAVLIGGSTNKYRLSQPAFIKLISDVEQIAGSLLITTSRRTGAAYIDVMRSRWRQDPRIYWYDGEGENPYLGMLACADAVWVTNDSVNMMTEALATGKPLHILPLQGHVGTKPAMFAENIIAAPPTPHHPVAMMESLPDRIREMLACRV